jgi:hypothetical protein
VRVRAGAVAQEAVAVLAGMGVRARYDIVDGPHGEDGDALVHLPNGFRLSLITLPGDDWPELMIQGRGGRDVWDTARGYRERLTGVETLGTKRGASLDVVVAYLCVMNEWEAEL